MSWPALALFAVGAYALKALGLLGLGRWSTAGALAHVVAALPVALIAGLVATQTLAAGTPEEIWTRLVGVAAGAGVAAARLPLLAVIVVAAAVTAALRAAL